MIFFYFLFFGCALGFNQQCYTKEWNLFCIVTFPEVLSECITSPDFVNGCFRGYCTDFFKCTYVESDILSESRYEKNDVKRIRDKTTTETYFSVPTLLNKQSLPMVIDSIFDTTTEVIQTPVNVKLQGSNSNFKTESSRIFSDLTTPRAVLNSKTVPKLLFNTTATTEFKKLANLTITTYKPTKKPTAKLETTIEPIRR